MQKETILKKPQILNSDYRIWIEKFERFHEKKKNKKLTASFWNPDDGGRLLGALTRSAVKWANLSSDLRTISRSKSSDFLAPELFSEPFWLLVPLLVDDGSALTIFSLEPFKEPELPLWVNEGGLGLGGGVDFPKECFLMFNFSGLGWGGKEVGWPLPLQRKNRH